MWSIINPLSFRGKRSDEEFHGNPDGLRSLAQLLLELADTNQEKMKDLPVGAREHYHISPNLHTSKSSVGLIIGRLDAKGTGSFYDAYIEKDKN